MSIWLIIGLIAVVGGIIALFALRKKGIIDKPKPPAYDGNKGITIPATMTYVGNYDASGPEPNTVPVWIDERFKFTPETEQQRVAVNEVVNRAARDVLRLAEYYNPEWKGKLPPITEMHVYFIEKMAVNSKGQPVLVVQSFTNDGMPTSEPVWTAGTVLNAKRTIRPSVGNPINPYTVQPIWDGWADMASLYNYVFNEFEHLVEIWVSWEEFFSWSGANDAHPHRPEVNAPVGLMSRERSAAPASVCFGAAALEGPAVKRV